LSEPVRNSIEHAIATAGAVVDVTALSRAILDEHPDLRFEIEELTAIVVALVTEKGLAVRFE